MKINAIFVAFFLVDFKARVSQRSEICFDLGRNISM